MRLVLLSFLIAALAVSAAMAEDEKPRCENCGMFWEKSATRIEFTIKVDGKEHSHMVECISCLHDLVHETYGNAMPASISILDFATFGAKKEVLIDAFDAWFLFDTERLAGSMPPFTAAFSSEESAKKYQQELGGELVDFDGMRKLMQKAKGESSGDKHDGHNHSADADAVYVCPCKGDCCTDIVTDSPGECPKCGMGLVKKS